MHASTLAILELGLVFFALGLLGRLAHRVGISPVPFYLLGGLAFGHGGFLELPHIMDFASVASEIGVILLLFVLGLEYSARELVTGMRRSWQAGVLDIVLNALPGALLVLAMGWGPLAALAFAGVTYISSSGIIAKVLSDLKRLGNRETPIILSLLVFEDLVMAIYLPVLTTLLAGVSFLTGARSLAIALGAVAVVMVIALRYGHVLSRLIESELQEAFMLVMLGATLFVAGVAAQINVSSGVGAFLLGIAIAGSTAEKATRLVEPLRDLFAAMFFVVFGLTTSPATIPGVLAPALLLAIITAITKIATGIWAARRQGIALPGQIRTGTTLVTRGEFSIVIASLAMASGTVPQTFGALATVYVLLLAVIGPILARLSGPLAHVVAAAKRLRRAQGAG
ncbi:cation:proton antiporter [Devriesea agamarum]|uniref:cation:proton antiporter n=1 Tax=Devriesea agamarum TaxID=472569 RepID=UPI00071E2868|nr:cation:proton antiporter [Devriesea agamarum]